MYSAAMQRPYFWPAGPMNVFMSIHDPPSHWLVCRKTTNSTIAYFVFAQNLLASSEFSNKQTSLRILMYSATIQHPNYYYVGLWMYLCRFMVHRVIDWCAAKQQIQPSPILSSLRIFSHHQNSQTSKHRCGSWCTAQPFNTQIITWWDYECIYVDSWSIESLIGVPQKQQIQPSPILSSLRTIYVWSALDLLVSSEKSNKQTSLQFQMNSATMQLPS
jgi:hypothetical protein